MNENMNENNNQNSDFFEQKEISQVGSSATKEAMDTSFVEPKKHHYGLIAIIVLLLLIIGGCCLYYFVLDTPKKTFTTIIDKLAQNDIAETISKNDTENLNYKYSLGLNISSKDEEINQFANIISKIKLNGETNYEDDKIIQNSVIEYNNGKLLDATYMLDMNTKLMYLKLNDILDKTIKININENGEFTEIESALSEINFTKDDYVQLYNSFINAIKYAIENAKYERKITKVDGSFVFQEKLPINKEFNKLMITKLLQDNDFLQTMAKITSRTTSQVSDALNESLSDLSDDEVILSVYKTIFKNEVLKIEFGNEDGMFSVTKDDDIYNYSFTVPDSVLFKGYVKTTTSNNENNVAFSIEIPDEDTTIEINISYTNSTNKLTIDTSNAVDFNDLDEKDAEKLMKYITENKTVTAFLEETGLKEMISQTSDDDM